MNTDWMAASDRALWWSHRILIGSFLAIFVSMANLFNIGMPGWMSVALLTLAVVIAAVCGYKAYWWTQEADRRFNRKWND